MKHFLLFIALLSSVYSGEFRYSISPITLNIKHQMIKGNSYRQGCPVSLDKLRYIQLSYIGFDQKDHTGELIVHKDVAQDIVDIFAKLYDARYPIHQMRLVSHFQGNDWRSIEADNTSAFNCRNATHSHKFSKHAYGKAIDINPIENPYISRTGHISHKASYRYKNRTLKSPNTPQNRAIITKDSLVYKLFIAHHWSWGGDWHYTKDYQHFQK
jgi:poly-gamma-glutamate synthesis protein (capsule biosynthesis protein)